MIRKTIYRYYSEKNLERVDIGFDLRLTNEEDIVRSDCAKASLRYTFFAKKFGTNERIPGPEVILVGRIKPDFHHYKAGNHNNILFNEQMEGEFIVFLDNDMKPKPDFLLRTLPFFYYYHESSKRYEVNKGVAFLQSPQFFKDTTIAGESDFLGGRNSVFFQGIQHGRDGYDLCSFAGTNAIFRLPALHTIGGVPYGSLTEDAHTAIKLHQYGYRSVYVPDKLAVGIAPVTVANSLQQRARWCKGSVQLSLIYLFGFKIKEKEIPKWSKKNPFPIEERRQINYFNNYSFSKQATRNMFRKFFFVDTMAWPFSAVTAIFYMIVAFIFVVTAEAPISFLKTPLLYRAFLITFLPYFALRLIFQYLSYHGVNAQDVWVSQEIWFSYSFASVYGIIDALKEQITGKGLGGWGVTGEGTRSSKLEYPNVIVVFVLILVIIIRAILFAISSNRTPVEAASIFFAGTIIFQMWPVTSASIYEWINNAHLTPEDKVDLKRYEIPKYIIFAFLIIFFVIVGQLLG
jgi:cellulose synthase (UDP-forming)